MDEFDDSGDGGFNTSGLIQSLANNATSAYETTAALSANPLNTALVYGGTAQTAQGYAGGVQPGTGAGASISAGGSGLLLLLLAGGVIIFALSRR